MNAVLDTNVIVDVLTGRVPFFADSARVLDRAEKGEYVAWLCATTVTTLFYLVRRSHGTEVAVEKLRDLMAICEVAPVNRPIVESALAGDFSDFEDAVLHEAAATAGADCIVTRNVSDFRRATLMVFTPAQFLEALARERRERGIIRT